MGSAKKSAPFAAAAKAWMLLKSPGGSSALPCMVHVSSVPLQLSTKRYRLAPSLYTTAPPASAATAVAGTPLGSSTELSILRSFVASTHGACSLPHLRVPAQFTMQWLAPSGDDQPAAHGRQRKCVLPLE